MRVKTNIYMNNEDYENAKKHFEKILSIRDDILWAKLGLGKIYF